MRGKRKWIYQAVKVAVGVAVVVIVGTGIFFTFQAGRAESQADSTAEQTGKQELKRMRARENPNEDEYIFPQSDAVLLTEADIAGCSREQLRLGRNEIFARHGYLFRTPEIAEYFGAKSWYHGTTPGEHFDSNLLSGIELQNIDFLAAAQKWIEYTYSAPHVLEKLTEIQEGYLFPPEGADAETLIHTLWQGDKPLLLAFRLSDLDYDEVPILFFAYLTYANGTDTYMQTFSGYWELWAVEDDVFTCVQKEPFQVSAAGGGESLAVGITDSNRGQSAQILSAYCSTQDVSEYLYTFVEETGIRDKYQIYQYWGEDAREPDGTHNGGKLTDAAEQLERCKNLQKKAQPLFFVGFNAPSESSEMIEVYEDVSQNVQKAYAAVQALADEQGQNAA